MSELEMKWYVTTYMSVCVCVSELVGGQHATLT